MIAADRSGLRARNVREPPPETRPTFEQSPIARVVRSLDAYPKVQEDYVTGSTAGGIITFVCAAICARCSSSEYAHHRTTTIASEVKVDTVGVDRLVPNADRLRVHIDVTFHALACELITLDTMDQAGEEHHGVHEGHLKKRRLDRHGEPIEKEYTVEPANKHKVVHEELEKMRKASSGGTRDTKDTPCRAATVAKRRLSRSALATTRTRTDVRTAATAAVTGTVVGGGCCRAARAPRCRSRTRCRRT